MCFNNPVFATDRNQDTFLGERTSYIELQQQTGASLCVYLGQASTMINGPCVREAATHLHFLKIRFT